MHDVVRHADVVRSAGDNTVNPWWGAATVMKGTAEAMLGNASRARILLESALPVTVDLPGFHAAALAHLALLDLAAGDGDGAVERSAAARTRGRQVRPVRRGADDGRVRGERHR